MALSVGSLSSRIESNLQAMGFEKVKDTGAYKQYSQPFIKAIAKAIIEEIKQNAQVLDQNPKSGGVWKVS